jgi:hypothetical protein
MFGLFVFSAVSFVHAVVNFRLACPLGTLDKLREQGLAMAEGFSTAANLNRGFASGSVTSIHGPKASGCYYNLNPHTLVPKPLDGNRIPNPSVYSGPSMMHLMADYKKLDRIQSQFPSTSP